MAARGRVPSPETSCAVKFDTGIVVADELVASDGGCEPDLQVPLRLGDPECDRPNKSGMSNLISARACHLSSRAWEGADPEDYSRKRAQRVLENGQIFEEGSYITFPDVRVSWRLCQRRLTVRFFNISVRQRK